MERGVNTAGLASEMLTYAEEIQKMEPSGKEQLLLIAVKLSMFATRVKGEGMADYSAGFDEGYNARRGKVEE